MDTRELANAFTDLCKKGEFDAAGQRFWADSVVSLEPMEGPMARCEGRPAVEAKGQWWYENHEIHGFSTEGPYVHGEQFAVRFSMDVTPKIGEQAGQRMAMTEVGLYTVKNGKIVEERFFY